MTMKSDFILESNGHCFLCMNQTSPSKKPEPRATRPPPSSTLTHSLQYLLKFLKLDLMKVFKEQESVPVHLSTRIENSTLKAELCNDCVLFMYNFSKLYQQLEKIKLQVASSIKIIHEKMLDVEISEILNEPDSTDDFQNWSKGKLDILQIVRTEAIQKCLQKLCSETPRVKLFKMHEKDIDSENLKLKENESANDRHHRGTSSDSSLEPADNSLSIKPNLETEHSVVNSQSDDEDESDDQNFWSPTGEADEDPFTSSYSSVTFNGDNDEHESQGDIGPLNHHQLPLQTPPIQYKKSKMKRKNSDSNKSFLEESSLVNKLGNMGTPRFNPMTEKFGCTICSSEFSTKRIFRVHYKSIHLNVRYRCSICLKIFTQEAHYLSHHRIIHKGVRFSCSLCNRQFADKSNLNRHQKNKRCEYGKVLSPKKEDIL